MIHLFYNIPRYMYGKKKFSEGRFVLLVDEQPLANGYLVERRPGPQYPIKPERKCEVGCDSLVRSQVIPKSTGLYL